MRHDHLDGDILPLEFMVRKEDWTNGVSLYLRQETVGVGCYVAQPVEMKALQPGFHGVVAPFMKLGIHEAQNLMDELWRAGLRPSEGSGSAGALAATQRHLEDMRALVFKESAR